MRQYCLNIIKLLALIFLTQLINQDSSPDRSYGIHTGCDDRSNDQTMNNYPLELQHPLRTIGDDGRSMPKAPRKITNEIDGRIDKSGNGVCLNDHLGQQLLSAGQVVSKKEIALDDNDNLRKRITVLETDFKYPYVRVEETLTKGNIEQDEVILTRKVMVADHILVKLKAGVDEEQLQQINQRHQAEIIKELGSAQIYVVKFNHHAVETVSDAVVTYGLEESLIAYAEPDYLVQILDVPNDPKYREQWSLAMNESTETTPHGDIGAAQSWDIQIGSADVVVAVVDTGVDYTHPDLLENIWENPGEIGYDLFGNDKSTNGIDDDENGYVDDRYGWNFYGGNNDPMDDNRHGTHVAGIIGASGNNSLGVSGVCWKTSLLPIKLLNSAGIGATSDAVDAINYCTNLGIDISNNSWGGEDYSQALSDAIDGADQANCVIVAAAGNEGQDISDSPVYPASYDLPNIISVTATSQMDKLPWFANYGVRNVDLAAPGVRILSTFPNGKYGYLDGTSMAAPHVSGALAMLKSSYSELSAVQLKHRILAATDAQPALEDKCQTGGRLNVYRALNDELIADYTFDMRYGTAPAIVEFTNTSLGSYLESRWDFGDGTPISEEHSPTHTFKTTGTYTVTLTVDSSNGTSIKTRTISVMNTYEVASIPFAWIDPTGMTKLVQLQNDDVSEAQEIPFEFKFYGHAYQKLYIGSNGLFGFAPRQLEQSSNRNLPHAGLSTPALFPYWDDLNPEAGGTIYVGTIGDYPHRQLIITWQDIPHFYKPSPPFSFQVVLNETTHDIEFHYRDVHPESTTVGGARSATIGIQSANALLSTRYAYNGNVTLTNNQAIVFSRKRSDETVPTSNDDVEIHDLNLRPKWNLISPPIQPLTSDVTDLFRGVSISDITYWDNPEGQYKGATHLQPNVGYWVYAYEHEDSHVEVLGKRPKNPEITLHKGWNLVGVTRTLRPSDYDLPVGSIWGWNPEQQSYVEIFDNDYLIPGNGYWVHSTNEFHLQISE